MSDRLTYELLRPSFERSYPSNTHSPGDPPMNRIALAADHGGYELKEAVKQLLDERAIPYHVSGRTRMNLVITLILPGPPLVL